MTKKRVPPVKAKPHAAKQFWQSEAGRQAFRSPPPADDDRETLRAMHATREVREALELLLDKFDFHGASQADCFTWGYWAGIVAVVEAKFGASPEEIVDKLRLSTSQDRKLEVRRES